MRWHTYKTCREPGFRLNMIDIMLLLSVCLLSWFGRQALSENMIYLLPVYVGFSFFLFCNVFRIGNKLEAFWYIPFVLLTIYGLSRPEIFWLVILGVCEPLRLGLVLYHIRHRKYVGAFYKQVEKFQGKQM